jgi:hypothetical protein
MGSWRKTAPVKAASPQGSILRFVNQLHITIVKRLQIKMRTLFYYLMNEKLKKLKTNIEKEVNLYEYSAG